MPGGLEPGLETVRTPPIYINVERGGVVVIMKGDGYIVLICSVMDPGPLKTAAGQTRIESIVPGFPTTSNIAGEYTGFTFNRITSPVAVRNPLAGTITVPPAAPWLNVPKLSPWAVGVTTAGLGGGSCPKTTVDAKNETSINRRKTCLTPLIYICRK